MPRQPAPHHGCDESETPQPRADSGLRHSAVVAVLSFAGSACGAGNQQREDEAELALTPIPMRSLWDWCRPVRSSSPSTTVPASSRAPQQGGWTTSTSDTGTSLASRRTHRCSATRPQPFSLSGSCFSRFRRLFAPPNANRMARSSLRNLRLNIVRRRRGIPQVRPSRKSPHTTAAIARIRSLSVPSCKRSPLNCRRRQSFC